MSLNITLPAGKYYIGDPCYVFDKEWSAICDYIFSGHEHNGLYHSPKGYIVAYGSTSYGDGTYEGSNGSSYFVDSGMLGIVSFDAIAIENKLSLDENYYSIVDFTEDVFVFITDDGQFTFGDIFIDTIGDDDDYDDYDDSYDGDDGE